MQVSIVKYSEFANVYLQLYFVLMNYFQNLVNFINIEGLYEVLLQMYRLWC